MLFGQHLDTTAIQSTVVTNLTAINSPATEFAPFVIGEEIYYVTEGRKGRSMDKKIGERFWDIKKAYLTEDDKALTAYLSEEINSPYFESSLHFHSIDSTMYFTRTNWQEGGLKKSKKDAALLRIFASRISKGLWEDAKALIFQSIDANFCHPSIIESDDMLIFSSDMEGGYGQMDLYKIPLDAVSIEEAVNLGPEVNSPANEIFPFYHESGNLIFASDFGTSEKKNLNLYSVNLTNPEAYKESLFADFMSDEDDFSLYINSEGTEGYFSSNRSGGAGRDDIYAFKSEQSIFIKESEEIIEEIIETEMAKLSELKLIFKNPDLSNIKDVTITLHDLDNSELSQKLMVDSSQYLLEGLEIGQSYKLVVEKEGYHSFYKSFEASDEADQILVFLEKKAVVVPIEEVKPKEIVIPKAVGSIVVFNNIFYEYNSAEIKEGGADELDVLARAMKKQSSMKVRLVSHTDSRGRADYNMSLSERRAHAAKKYLVSKGIASHRIFTLGVGEMQIRNHCKDGIFCSDREHRYNRRTEVQIIEQ
jgi:outer membrane protein OmpA-like peptidoglycan-associated protein